MFRKIQRHTEPPKSTIPMRSVEGTRSIHTTPTVQITIDRVPAAPAVPTENVIRRANHDTGIGHLVF